LLPLMQYANEQKSMLEEQVANLKKLASNTRNNKMHQAELKAMINQAHAQLNEAESIQQQLETPPPSEHSHIQDIAIQ